MGAVGAFGTCHKESSMSSAWFCWTPKHSQADCPLGGGMQARVIFTTHIWHWLLISWLTLRMTSCLLAPSMDDEAMLARPYMTSLASLIGLPSRLHMAALNNMHYCCMSHLIRALSVCGCCLDGLLMYCPYGCCFSLRGNTDVNGYACAVNVNPDCDAP